MAATQQHGFFHSIKEKLFHGEKHIDADYEAALSKFQLLESSLNKTRASVNNYSGSMYSILLNSNSAAVEFATMLEDSAIDNDYQKLCNQLKSAHAGLNSQKQQVLTQRLADRVLKPLDELAANCVAINQRVAQRNEFHNSLEYYLNKVNELNKEREERGSKGKPESSANVEKLQRNQEKLNVARNDYSAFSTTLIADLTNAWNGRVKIMGPALASFVEVEKEFIEMYGTGLSTVAHSDQLQRAPAGIVPPLVQPSNFGLAPSAQPLAQLPLSNQEGVVYTAPVSTAPVIEHRDGAAIAPVATTIASSTTIAPGGVIPTTFVASDPPPMKTFAEYQAEQGQQFPKTPATENVYPVAGAPIGASGVGVGDALKPTVVDSNPFEAEPIKTEAVTHTKAVGEEESKRQRFEEDNKLRA